MAYTASEKKRALKIFASQGATKAHKQTGVPQRTIYVWARAAGLVDKKIKQTEKANAASRQIQEADWHNITADLFDDLRHLRNRLREKTVEYRGQQGKRVEYDEPPADAVRNLMMAIAILIDKLQLITGKVTSRHEVIEKYDKMSTEDLLRAADERHNELRLVLGDKR